VNALLGGGGDRGCHGRVVEDDGDGRGREIKILGQHFKGGRSVGVGEVPFSCHHAPRGGCATYGNSCTPLAGTAHGGEIGYESLLETSFVKITK
jgi:hypothetical protein